MLRSALVILFFSGPAAAASFSVQQDGSGDYQTLQEALAYAAEGDTIEVGPGTYFESLQLGSVTVQIRSTDGPETTILDASGSSAVLSFSSGASPAHL